MAHKDDARTFAVALHGAFYQTAMMGKYLNGYQPERHGVPQGWSGWAVAGNGYPNFNYVLNANGKLITSDLHLTDELAVLGQAFISGAAAGPFFLELATFSPHGPYVPPARYATAFADLDYPRSPAFGARPDAAAPGWLRAIPALKPGETDRMAEAYRNRVRSDKGIDDMIGVVRQRLNDLGLAGDTYVMFTSDNGYHLGEYSLRAGKMTPFDTDIHVPLVVVGPGVAAGGRVDDITMNIDFYPTFTELAGLAADAKVDGRSLVSALHGLPGPRRNIAVVEHQNTRDVPGNPDLQEQRSGNPPTYVALRLPGAMYVEYDTGEVGYYDLATDPYELHNIAGSLTPERRRALHAAVVANHACVGAAACAAAQALTP
jgi:arylsulfatase A-like enzyme